MLRLIVAMALSACMLTACSKSPADATLDLANAVSSKLMSNLIEKDASHQAEGLIRNLDPRSNCQPYIDRLREAGHGSPYEGATEWAIGNTYAAAGKAGCVKPN